MALPSLPGIFPVDAGSFPVAAEIFPADAESFPVAAGSFPVDAGSFPVNAGSFPVNAGSFPVNAESFPVDAESFPGPKVHLLSTLRLTRKPNLKQGRMGMQQLSSTGRGGFRIPLRRSADRVSRSNGHREEKRLHAKLAKDAEKKTQRRKRDNEFSSFFGYAGNTAPDHIDHLHAMPAWFRFLHID